jgi:uncharacterized protein YjbI with pentapeptide repeats
MSKAKSFEVDFIKNREARLKKIQTFLESVNYNLSGANLNDANLSDANLNSANLNGASIRSASLNGADLSYSDITGVEFEHAYTRVPFKVTA